MDKHTKGQSVGYVRVSSADQNPARQIKAIGEVDRLFTDTASGKNTQRPQLKEMLAYVREGDTVRVEDTDRLARSTTDLLHLVSKLRDKGVAVQFISSPALNTDTAQGEFVLTILAAVAQLERSLIRERQAEGIAIAKARGVYERTPKLKADQVRQAQELDQAGVPKVRIARQLGVSRSTIYAVLKGSGIYATDSNATPFSA